MSIKAIGRLTLGDKFLYPIGLGTNKITNTAHAHMLIQHALKLNVNFFDTANMYHNGEAEITLANVLRPYMKDVCLATKGGFILNASGKWKVNGAPFKLIECVNQSLMRMKVDCIDLYQLHRIDPHVPLEDSVGTLRQLQVEGKIMHIGLSEVSIQQLERARKEAKIMSVQNYFNICKRDNEDVVDYCTESSIIFIPFYPLGSMNQYFPIAMQKLLGIISNVLLITPQQIALAWLLQRSPFILPIPGTISFTHLKTNVQSTHVKLSTEHIDAIDTMYNSLLTGKTCQKIISLLKGSLSIFSNKNINKQLKMI